MLEPSRLVVPHPPQAYTERFGGRLHSPSTSESSNSTCWVTYSRRAVATDALTIFNLNAEVYPTSDVALESLAEAEALSGDAAQALATFRRAAAVEPHSATAKEMIRRLTVPPEPVVNAKNQIG